MTASALYEGTIRHRRFAEEERSFEHPIMLAYLDLDELPSLLGGRLVDPRPGLARFRRRDFHGPRSVDLAEAVRATVRRQSGRTVDGPIRLLAQLRTLGVAFNPVSFYYCFDRAGEQLQAVLAEVTNTPWRERHAYVLASDTPESGILSSEMDKQMHVSPFMAMDYRYRIRLSNPGPTLSVHIENWAAAAGTRDFDATLALARRELSPGSLRQAIARQPFGPLRVLALIYGHAVGLKLAGVGIHAHPRSSAS